MRCTHERNAIKRNLRLASTVIKCCPSVNEILVFLALLRRAVRANKTAIRDTSNSKNLRYGRASQLVTCTGPCARVCTLC